MLPESWVNRIFEYQECLHGNRAAAMWEGTNIAAVKLMWRTKLAGFRIEAIKRALGETDELQFPPSLPTFITLCRNAERSIGTDKPMLECKLTPEQIERNKQRVAEMIAGLMKAKSL